MEILILIGALVIILLGAEAFTNSLEHFGERLGISEGVTGSDFCRNWHGIAGNHGAVCLPFCWEPGRKRYGMRWQSGPFWEHRCCWRPWRFFLVGIFAARSRGWQATLNPEPKGFARDLVWFNWAFCIGVMATFVPPDWPGVRGVMAFILVGMYVTYLTLTIRASTDLVDVGHGTEADHPLYLMKIGLPDNLFMILFQLGCGLGLIMLGAKGFVYGIEHLAPRWGISALTLSLLIVPVATELPEKVNSILWIRRGRDTLAVGNLTGAMMFQGSLLPAVGIMLTAWVPQQEILMGMAMTLVAATYLTWLVRHGTVKPIHLVFNGVCYLGFVLSVIFW